MKAAKLKFLVLYFVRDPNDQPYQRQGLKTSFPKMRLNINISYENTLFRAPLVSKLPKAIKFNKYLPLQIWVVLDSHSA